MIIYIQLHSAIQHNFLQGAPSSVIRLQFSVLLPWPSSLALSMLEMITPLIEKDVSYHHGVMWNDEKSEGTYLSSVKGGVASSLPGFDHILPNSW